MPVTPQQTEAAYREMVAAEVEKFCKFLDERLMVGERSFGTLYSHDAVKEVMRIYREAGWNVSRSILGYINFKAKQQ